METNLQAIAQYGRLRKAENEVFQERLKAQDPAWLDSLVHQLQAAVSAQIDCKACGNCCRDLSPPVSEKDVDTLADGLGITARQVKEKYTVYEEELDAVYFNDVPCPFLCENVCGVYAHRPEVCRDFPFLHKPDFMGRLYGVLQNYSICPIVFNVFERLKQAIPVVSDF